MRKQAALLWAPLRLLRRRRGVPRLPKQAASTAAQLQWRVLLPRRGAGRCVGRRPLLRASLLSAAGVRRQRARSEAAALRRASISAAKWHWAEGRLPRRRQAERRALAPLDTLQDTEHIVKRRCGLIFACGCASAIGCWHRVLASLLLLLLLRLPAALSRLRKRGC